MRYCLPFCRLLLEGPPSSPRPLSLHGDDVNEADLDEERYADSHAEVPSREEEEERHGAEEPDPTGDEDQFAWSYEGEGVLQKDARRVRSHLETSASTPDRKRSWMPGVELPSSLASSLPETLNAWDVMVKTADAVRSGGGPMEMVLRVRQSGKPLFAFLRPEDELHELFRWLVATPSEQRRGAGLGKRDETAWAAKQEVIMRRSARKVQVQCFWRGERNSTYRSCPDACSGCSVYRRNASVGEIITRSLCTPCTLISMFSAPHRP